VGKLLSDVLCGLLGFGVFAWIVFAANRYMYGWWFVIPQGKSYLNLGHAHPFFLLFSARNGLLYWHPLMWPAVLGLGVLCVQRKNRPLGVVLLVPCLLELWISSAVLDWHGAASHGARRLVSLSAVFVMTSAISLQWIHEWLKAKSHRYVAALASGVIGLGGLVTFGLAYKQPVPWDGAIAAPQLYAEGLRVGLDTIHQGIGNPLVLPASLVYAARSRVAPRRFDEINGGMFIRDYKTMRSISDPTVTLRGADATRMLADGFELTPEGLSLGAGKQGRLLMELYWPWITHVTLIGHPVGNEPVDVEMNVASFFWKRRAATFRLTKENPRVEIPIAKGAFDSGMNEVTFKATGPFVMTQWTWEDRVQRNTSVR